MDNTSNSCSSGSNNNSQTLKRSLLITCAGCPVQSPSTPSHQYHYNTTNDHSTSASNNSAADGTGSHGVNTTSNNTGISAGPNSNDSQSQYHLSPNKVNSRVDNISAGTFLTATQPNIILHEPPHVHHDSTDLDAPLSGNINSSASRTIHHHNHHYNHHHHYRTNTSSNNNTSAHLPNATAHASKSASNSIGNTSSFSFNISGNIAAGNSSNTDTISNTVTTTSSKGGSPSQPNHRSSHCNGGNSRHQCSGVLQQGSSAMTVEGINGRQHLEDMRGLCTLRRGAKGRDDVAAGNGSKGGNYSLCIIGYLNL